MHTMKPGDHIFANCGLYAHHGIYIGDGKVVHYAKTNAGQTKIALTSLEEFAKGRAIKIVRYEFCDRPEVVVQRALSRLGVDNYDLIFNNCEHFATWCKTGDGRSAQVEAVSDGLGHLATSISFALGEGLAKAAIARSAQTGATWMALRQAGGLAAKEAAKGAGRALTPWLLLSDLMECAVHYGALQAGAKPGEAKAAAAVSGAVSSAAIGGLAAGPVGALVGLSVWAVGKALGAVLGALTTSSKEANGHAKSSVPIQDPELGTAP